MSTLRASFRTVGNRLIVRKGRLSVAFDASHGSLCGIRYGAVQIAAAATRSGFTIDGDNQTTADFLGLAPSLTGSNWAAKRERLSLRCRLADIETEETIDFRMPFPGFSRTLRFRYTGKAGGKFRDTTFFTSGVKLGKRGFYTLPAAFPPFRKRAAALEPGKVVQHRAVTPFQIGPAIVELSPALSVLWLTTPSNEFARVRVCEGHGEIAVRQSFASCGWLEPGAVQDGLGPAFLQIIEGDATAALHAIWEFCDARGLKVPRDRPAWTRDAAVYSFHAGGTIASGLRDLGGFTPATETLLPHLPGLGFNTVWLLPVEDQGTNDRPACYHPNDYYKLQRFLGTPRQLRKLVDTAHNLGMRVLLDLVPHGGSNRNRRAKEHPEWLIRNESGETLGYWGFDFNNRTWQAYIGRVAEHYMSTYGIDGFRVDAIVGSHEPNWARDIPYQRASIARLHGGVTMLETIRQATRKANPSQGAILAECGYNLPYQQHSDVKYDMVLWRILEQWRRFRVRPLGAYVASVQTWLEQYQHVLMRDGLMLRFIESHDTTRATPKYGVRGTRMLMALISWLDGVPLFYHEMEIGHGPYIAELLAIRKRLRELRRGTAHFSQLRVAPRTVLAFVRRCGEQWSAALFNFSHEPARVRLDVSEVKRLGIPLTARWAVYDAREKRYLARQRVLARDPKVGFTMAGNDYKIIAFRNENRRVQLPLARAKTPRPVRVPTTGAPALKESAASLEIGVGGFKVRLSKKTGLPRWVRNDGVTVMQDVRLAKNRALARAAVRVVKYSVRQTRRAVVARFQLATHAGPCTLVYRFDGNPGFRLETRLANTANAEYAALVMHYPDTEAWAVQTAEGRLAERFVARHVYRREPRTDRICWRPQGTDTIWTTETLPLSLTDPQISVDHKHGAQLFLALGQPLRQAPDNVELRDKRGATIGLHSVLAWCDPTPGLPAQGTRRRIDLAVRPEPPAPAAPDLPNGIKLVNRSIGWQIETGAYRVQLGNAGTIRELWARAAGERLALTDCDLYVHNMKAHHEFHAVEDIETEVRIRRRGENLKMRFYGRMRGPGRFDLSRPRVEYFMDYLFGAGGAFRFTIGWKWNAPVVKQATRAVATFNLARPAACRFLKRGVTLAKNAPPVRCPDEIRLSTGGRPGVTLAGIRSKGPVLPRRAALQANRLQVFWVETQHELPGNEWCQTSCVVAMPGPKPPRLPGPQWMGDSGRQGQTLARTRR